MVNNKCDNLSLNIHSAFYTAIIKCRKLKNKNTYKKQLQKNYTLNIFLTWTFLSHINTFLHEKLKVFKNVKKKQ